MSWDCETGFSDSSDLDISVEDREEIETVEEFIMKSCRCQYAPKNTQCTSIFGKKKNKLRHAGKMWMSK